MYCTKCGNELNNNEQFCPKCGAESGKTEKPIINISTDEIKDKATKMKTDLVSGVSGLGKNRNTVFAILGLLVLGAILVNTPIFNVSGLFGASLSLGLFDGVNSLNSISIIMYIISIVLILFPIITKKVLKPIYFLPAKLTSFWTVLWFLFVLLSSTDKINRDYQGIASLSLTVTGWLLVIVTVATIVFSFILSSRIKKAIASYKSAQNPTSESADGLLKQ